ncbi:hypothetical protein C8J57DRAFT_1223960 [Mycena rebaudengoi]|nr:hypothetical protein C8J57DRAFT_1223960 [Mycena rebaudengoi]
MILDHLEELTTRFSIKKAASNKTILECLEYAEAAAYDTYPEDVWEKAYDDRWEEYKKNASEPAKPLCKAQPKDLGGCLSDGSAFRNARSAPNETIEIRQDIEASEPERHVDLETHIQKWTLNKEQAQAFRIIASHSLEKNPEQLRMFLTGAGGTGKSQVIHTLSDFF